MLGNYELISRCSHKLVENANIFYVAYIRKSAMLINKTKKMTPNASSPICMLDLIEKMNFLQSAILQCFLFERKVINV